MPRINQSVETSVINEQGELIEKRANRVLSWGDEPNFIKLYIDDILYLQDMPQQYAKLTWALLQRISYAGDQDGMCVVLVSRIKKAICEELGWKRIQTFDNALRKLVDGKILYRIDRSIYRFNPYLFGKGDWQDISRLRLEVNYDEFKGKTFETIIKYKEHEPQIEGQLSFNVGERAVNE